jgi:proteasome lid subunit RPN8/RPN11
VAGGQEVGLVFHTHPTLRIKMSKLDRTDAPAVSDYATVHLVFELSKAKWLLGMMLPGSQKMSR